MAISNPTPGALIIPVSEKDHVRGQFNAPMTLLEYGDYECDYCGRAFPIVREIRKHFAEQLRFVFRNFPHSSIHPRASVAAQAAEAAGAQGKFWEMHDILYEHQNELATADLTHYALRVGLELYHFQSDLQTERFARRVESDHQGGIENGVRKTPTFFVNGMYYAGPMDRDAMITAIGSGTSPGNS